MENFFETMKRVHWSLTGVFALAIVAVMLVPVGASADHCKGKHKNEPGCDGTNDPPGERITGSVVFDAGNSIMGDGVGDGSYTDDDFVGDFTGNNFNMQVAINCSFDQFNLNPGGADRIIQLDLNGSGFGTAITSCKVDGVETEVNFDNTSNAGITDALGDEIDCDDSDPDWGFNQVFRTSPGTINVCDLAVGQYSEANMRFQTNLHHRRGSCKGGSKKCGVSREGIEVNYGNTSYCSPTDKVKITRTLTGWDVESTGPGCLSHESGGAAVSVDLPFRAIFTEN